MNQTLKLLAHPNLRGIPTDRLIYDLQDLRESVLCATDPEIEGELRYFFEQGIAHFEQEITRRRKLTYEGVQYTNREIIQAIKNVINIEDVLAWYTEVFLEKRTWAYRCTLHGNDQHPSGVIYRDEKRCHCFVCEKGGDIFDVVQLFEHLDLPKAIAKLARHIGIDTKPLVKRNGPRLRDVSL